VSWIIGGMLYPPKKNAQMVVRGGLLNGMGSSGRQIFKVSEKSSLVTCIVVGTVSPAGK